MGLLLTVLVAFAIIVVIKGVIIVKQAEVVIVERLGKFDRVLESGFNFIIPVIETPRGILWKTTQKNFRRKNLFFYKRN